MFLSPIVRIIHNAAGLITGDSLVFHNSLNCTLAIDNVFICLSGDVRDSDGCIVLKLPHSILFGGPLENDSPTPNLQETHLMKPMTGQQYPRLQQYADSDRCKRQY